MHRTFHTMCHILSLTSMILGMVGIVDWKKWNHKDMYYYDVVASGHSWMGVITISFWCIQFVAGLWIYVISKWPPGSENLKSQFIEVHNFTGYCVYGLGIASCVMGYQCMQSMDATALAMTAVTDDPNGAMYMPPVEGTYLGSVGEKQLSDFF